MMFTRRAVVAMLGSVAGATVAKALAAQTIGSGIRGEGMGANAPYIPAAPPVPAGAPAVVSTPLGRLRGTEAEGVRYFRGVAYAKPPIGELRFKHPQSIAPWDGVRDATRNPNAAPQIEVWNEAPGKSEDCLYLNIWAPSTPGPHPVYVYVHGGGNVSGYALEHRVDGAQFARDGIVCVNVGYRLGLLGFVELGHVLGPSYVGSGNNGLRDIIEALRWVRRCIAEFGGDPDNVTLGGQSAGAFNVVSLCASPAADGLFHRAIVQSGSGHGIRSLADANASAETLAREARATGLAPLDWPAAPASDLIAFQARALAYGSANGVIDNDILPGHPYQMAKWIGKAGRSLLIGYDRDEMSLFDAIGPEQLSADQKLAFERFRAMFASGRIEHDMMSFRTAMTFGVPSLLFANAFARSGGQVHVYEWNWAAASGPLAGKAFHGIEQPFVWNTPRSIAFRGVDPAPDHAVLAERVHRRWCNFIRFGHPAARGAPDWPTWTPETCCVLTIDREDSIGTATLMPTPWFASHIAS